ncbi:MAG: hypothetical protein JXR96_19620 [Deltaproteobacteria bacterium]|nr:hypothetical protein [Deltaproteobacteria bacterium]
MSDEPKFDNWKDAWEYHAAQSAVDYGKMSESELLKLIRAGDWDMFYTIWDAIGKKGSVEKAAPVLLEVLIAQDGEHADLLRYHCAGALFEILGIEDREELRSTIQWDMDNREGSIEELRAAIQEKSKK